MVKKQILLISIFTLSSSALDVYERNCVPCHQVIPASLQDMYKRYLLRYSSQTNIKKGLIYYLNNPSKDVSVMSPLFIKTYGIKHATLLSKENLDIAVSSYINRYKVLGKLK